jgi:hypothetical protein
MKSTRFRITAVGVSMPIAHSIVALILKQYRTPKGNFDRCLPIGNALCRVHLAWSNGRATCDISDV